MRIPTILTGDNTKPKLNVIPFTAWQEGQIGYRVNLFKGAASVVLIILVLSLNALLNAGEFIRGGVCALNIAALVVYGLVAVVGYLFWKSDNKYARVSAVWIMIVLALISTYALGALGVHVWSVLFSLVLFLGLVACILCITLTSWWPPYDRKTENWSERKEASK